MIPLRQTSSGIILSVKVQPRARKNAISGAVGDALKLALTAPPVEGKANQAVIDFLADFFEIPRSSITIASGKTSRLKVVHVSGTNTEHLYRRLREVSPM